MNKFFVDFEFAGRIEVEAQTEQDDFVRVIDESGEDYLYYKNHFVFVELPEEVVRVLVITWLGKPPILLVLGGAGSYKDNQELSV